jgi:hypothetical protein
MGRNMEMGYDREKFPPSSYSRTHTSTHKNPPNMHSMSQDRQKIRFPERQLDGKAQ